MKTRILIVEDDEDDYVITMDYVSQLSAFDIYAERATNAVMAIEKLKGNTFDLCLLDYQLGAVDGLEVLRQAQSIGVSAPIIMLTGQANEALDTAALNSGAADYLVKGEFDANRFARALRYALARRDVEFERIERLKAEAENRAKNLFLAHLSHELRTPLTAILGYTELLIDDTPDKSILPELEIILRNSNHLLSLLNDVLDLSKIAADQLELSIERVDVNNLVVDIYNLLKVSAANKNIHLHLHSQDFIPEYILSDATRIRQILINVLNNAIKFTNEGRIDMYLTTEKENNMELLCFTIKDTGIGIPSDKLASIFQPFSQVSNALSKTGGGTGLGLAISSELASHLGGDIRVESRVGQGSCFTVRINPGDISQVKRKTLGFDVHSYERRLHDTQVRGRVLIVDDNKDIRHLAGRLIQRLGAAVDYADNGMSALQCIEDIKKNNHGYDLVFMDIHMPTMDGEQAIRVLRQNGDDLCVIALTAATMRGNVDRLLTLGFNSVINKPIDTARLIQVLLENLPSHDSPTLSNTDINTDTCLFSPSNMISVVDDKHEFFSEKKQSDELLLKEQKPSHTGSTINTLRVLIVEDDKDVSGVLRLLLQKIGVEYVGEADTASGAMEFLNTQVWDVVVLDVHLPDASGLDILRAIRASQTKSNKNVYAAILSGSNIEPHDIKNLTIDRVLMKPIQLKTLRAMLDDAL